MLGEDVNVNVVENSMDIATALGVDKFQVFTVATAETIGSVFLGLMEDAHGTDVEKSVGMQ